MANSAKQYRKATLSGGVALNKRGKKQKEDDEKLRRQKSIIDAQQMKHHATEESAPVYKITLKDEVFYAVQRPDKKPGVLSKVPEKNLKRDLPPGAKTRAFDTTKRKANDLDYEKDIDLTITKTIR